jgi:Uma2 family endonuclease
VTRRAPRAYPSWVGPSRFVGYDWSRDGGNAMTLAATKPVPIFPQFTGTRRFTPDEYHRLGEAGILGPDDKVELLDGYILYKADYPELQSTDTAFPEWRALRQWSSAEYHRMLDLGIIDREEKLELLDGYLVLKMSQNPPHRTVVTNLSYCLPPQFPAGWIVMVHCPISLGDRDPEPDGVVVRGTRADYRSREPVAGDFGIVIEVSDSTLDMDRRAKGRGYARAGIPVYWIINLEDKRIEVYTDPDASANPPAYRTRTDYLPGTTVPITLDGVAAGTIAVSELLP